MNRHAFSPLVRHELRLQWRHATLPVYLGVAVLFIVVLRLIPEDARDLWAPLFIFVDPSSIGFFFVGGLVLLERMDGTLSAYGVAPVSLGTRLAAKTLGLSLYATLAGYGIALGAGLPFDPVLLGLGTFLTAVFFTFLGLLFATRFQTLNGYFIVGGTLISPIYLPFLPYFGLHDAPWYRLFPTDAGLRLIAGAYGGMPWSEVLIALTVLLFWMGVVWVWLLRWFDHYIIRGGEP